MKQLLTAMIALTALLFPLPVTAAEAQLQTGSNFVSGNPNNDGQYTPRKVRKAKDPNREPGFWDKEWKRSGLDKTVGGAWWSPLGKTGNFFKNKEEAYRAKNPAGTDR